MQELLGDLHDLTNRVRDLPPSPGRSAALQCLADAALHLAQRPSVPPGSFESNQETRATMSQA